MEFRNVSFRYEQGETVLKDISFKVRPGEIIGLVGHSGAGKTTLVNLICRFYDPDEGTIYIDGHDIKDVSLRSLRSQIGVVLQEPFFSVVPLPRILPMAGRMPLLMRLLLLLKQPMPMIL